MASRSIRDENTAAAEQGPGGAYFLFDHGQFVPRRWSAATAPTKIRRTGPQRDLVPVAAPEESGPFTHWPVDGANTVGTKRPKGTWAAAMEGHSSVGRRRHARNSRAGGGRHAGGSGCTVRGLVGW